jgi:hypothetical protein
VQDNVDGTDLPCLCKRVIKEPPYWINHANVVTICSRPTFFLVIAAKRAVSLASFAGLSQCLTPSPIVKVTHWGSTKIRCDSLK